MIAVRFSFVVTAACFLAACSGGAAPQQPEPAGPVVWNGDSVVAPVLVQIDPQPAQIDSLKRAIGVGELTERMAAAAEDTAAPWIVRANALRILAEQKPEGEMQTFLLGLQARDERVRVAAAAAMREFMVGSTGGAIDLLRVALRDRSPRVQAAALQVLGDRDVAVLREYAPRAATTELRGIALDLIRVAEERGAPLVARDTLGTLERMGPNGITLTFRPTTRWPEWDAAVGDLYITQPKKQPVKIASAVEAVAKVVPAYFTSDAARLVYEADREIHAYNLTTGEDVKLGYGIAPRVLPFTNDVIYLTEKTTRRSVNTNGTQLYYDVIKLPAAGGTPENLGELLGSTSFATHGNYSNVRWMTIVESDGDFAIYDDGAFRFQLPSPFGQ